MKDSASDLQPLVDAADVPALLRAIDGCCASRSWDALVDLARRCREAIELGKQLWPVAMHIEYRLAFEAPGPYAAGVLRPGAARFALGPLTEVAASTHAWAELAGNLRDDASAAAVAQERVIRGEDLRRVGAATQSRSASEPAGGDPHAVPAELPLAQQSWEPSYALPRYRDREALFPAPDIVGAASGQPRALQPATPLPDDPAVDALRSVVEMWTAQSEGHIDTASVDGDAAGAVARIAPIAAVEPISGQQALAWLQWCGASGGAYGRRPGGAAGRFAAWWTLAALAGVPWPDDPATDDVFAEALGIALDELRWYRWTPDTGSAADGWHLHLAVHDPVDGLAWAVTASDHRKEQIEPAEPTHR